ncbi:hypothetical protein CC1G_14269 [Coprinopsis cinerea okayama7|uniref:Uncharacterized protein n=1 Tax=Coprinopsis cinerea (strain Okayama-7 / 130 / ATCC MYA-4618 / FGSC 9003) TaxID=240176 RepID=D6RLR1_COPC7|nr:hypothetical protein CC1G_14269 [Coprinopsis cinerea okayama7\|eukprot:XP_002911738.1 hypothetical protein CC1G_14269 [Coprinopsis cinerea okayama7\
MSSMRLRWFATPKWFFALSLLLGASSIRLDFLHRFSFHQMYENRFRHISYHPDSNRRKWKSQTLVNISTHFVVGCRTEARTRTVSAGRVCAPFERRIEVPGDRRGPIPEMEKEGLSVSSADGSHLGRRVEAGAMDDPEQISRWMGQTRQSYERIYGGCRLAITKRKTE